MPPSTSETLTLLPLYGHRAVRERLSDVVRRGALPASILLHGPRGVGKQRLALWLGQMLLCTGADDRPCGKCQHCRYAQQGAHPDLHWFFPRPRPKDGDRTPDEVRADIAEAIGERIEAVIYPPPSGLEALHIATVRALVHTAVLSPALASRKVFIIGEADRMVAQEGSEEAANAFLKLLEEPSSDTTLILTSSEPGALLPTIRSRVVSVRVPTMPEKDVREMLADPRVAAWTKKELGGMSADAIVDLAVGAPGRLASHSSWEQAMNNARTIVDAAESGDLAKRAKAAYAQGVVGARGGFSDVLDALTHLLHERTRLAVRRGDEPAASAAARGMDAVERAKERAANNVNPQLLTAQLLRELASPSPSPSS